MPQFNATPLSTTTLGNNQFPVSAGYIPGSSGNLTSIQLGPSSTDAGGWVSAPVAVYQATGTNLHTVIDSGTVTVGALPAGSNTIGNVGLVAGSANIGGVELVDSGGTNKASISASGAVKVDNSGVTQPVSGTFWQATQPVSGTVTANAGTGTFNIQQTNITTDYDSGAGTQNMTMFGVALPASGGAVAGGTSSNPLRTDPTGTTTQPISGSISVSNFPGTQPVSGTITANTNADTTIGGTTAPSKGLLVIGKTNDGTAQYQPQPLGAGGRSVIVEGYSGGTAVPVSGTFWQATQPVSIASLPALPANQSVNVAQVAGGNSSNAGQTGSMQVGGAVATNTAVSSATNPLLIAGSDYGGTPKVQSLKVDASGNAQVAITNTPAVSQSGTWNVGLSSGSNLVGGVYVYDSAGTNKLAVDSSGRLTVASIASALPAGSAVIGSTTIQAASGTALAADQSNTELRTSLYGKSSAAGDTALKVNSGGDLYILGDFTEQVSLSAGSLNADLVPSTDVSAYKWVSLHINTNAYSGTLSFQGSNDNSTWVSVLFASQANAQPVSTTTTNGAIFYAPVYYRYLRVRMTSYTSGTAQGTLELYTQPAGVWNVNALAAQSGTWTMQPGNTANTTPWLVKPHDGSNALFLAASALADGTSNPTIGGIGDFAMRYNGASWDRARNNWNTTTGDTGAKTATFAGATQTNYDARGAIITILLGTVSGSSPTLAAQLQWSPDGGTTWLAVGTVLPNLTASSQTGVYMVYPTQFEDASSTTLAALTNGATVSKLLNMPLPRTWRLNYTIGGSSPSFTISSVQVNYLL